MAKTLHNPNLTYEEWRKQTIDLLAQCDRIKAKLIQYGFQKGWMQ